MILDGFDEMRPEHRAQNLWRTNDLGALWPALGKDAKGAEVGTGATPKLIVLCRSEMLAGQSPSEYLKVHTPSPRMLHLSPGPFCRIPGYVEVFAYCGSSNNLKDLKD